MLKSGGITLRLSDCVDRHLLCSFWSTINACKDNPAYMLQNCFMSCNRDICHEGVLLLPASGIAHLFSHSPLCNYNDFPNVRDAFNTKNVLTFVLIRSLFRSQRTFLRIVKLRNSASDYDNLAYIDEIFSKS